MSVYYPQARVSLRILFENFGKDDPLSGKQHSFNVVPKEVRVNINDYTKADEFSMELDYKTFPFDPRTIRAVGVTIFIEDIGRLQDEQFQPAELELRDNTLGDTNAVFMGFADKDSISFSDTDRSITLEGRDFTSLLIDQPYDDPSPLSVSTPLENVVGQIVTRLEATKDLKVIARGVDDLPTLASFAPGYSPLGGKKNTRRNKSYWDVIQDLAKRAGVIIFVELDQLVITKPNALYERSEMKQFIWGSNLLSLDFHRKLGRAKDFNILIRSVVVEEKKVVTVKIPEEATQAWSQKIGIVRAPVKIESLGPDGKKVEKQAPYISFRVPDIGSKKHLTEIGQNIFEEMGRQQIEGTIETRDMCVMEGDASKNVDPVEFDVLKIRNATPIDIMIKQDDLEAIEQFKSVSQRQEYLLARCYPPEVAQVFAETLGKFDTPFYTKAVEFSLSSTDGFKMRLNFINFIELPQSLVGLGL